MSVVFGISAPIICACVCDSLRVKKNALESNKKTETEGVRESICPCVCATQTKP